MRNDFRERIYKLKVTIVAIISFVTGLALLILSGYAEQRPELSWVLFWQFSSIGGTLFAAGLFGIVWDFFDGKDKEARDDERVRRLLKESAPDFRDAVVQGFAVNSDDLKRVATPQLLDDIAVNVLGLRLGDATFAREVYLDVRDQAIRAPERWLNVDVSVRLSSMDERNTVGVPRFNVTVEWEYTVTPSHTVQRFTCVSDREEFQELLTDVPSTSTWFMTPRPGFKANARESFELLRFSVDGKERPIHRTERKSGQTYSASIGDDVVRAGVPVRIRHVYRTITPKSGHRLFIAIGQPTQGLSLSLDYTDTDISHMSVTDLISSAKRPVVTRMPEEVAGKQIGVDVPGWLLPQAEVTFVWTLASEDHSLRSEDVETPTAA